MRRLDINKAITGRSIDMMKELFGGNNVESAEAAFYGLAIVPPFVGLTVAEETQLVLDLRYIAQAWKATTAFFDDLDNDDDIIL